ncbi:MAG: DUF6056 family protein [Lachnospiraceae bacterium]|nr:DUF6056 family protein [Lachnospiraceae bacterium]
MKKKTLFSKNNLLIYILLSVVILLLEFMYHRITPFMMDDIWYSTNLATNEPLKTVMDVFEGQVWHYNNWGGRSVTHTLLQLILMGGELFADILNVCAAAVLALVVTLFVSKDYKAFCFVGALVMMIGFNPNIQYSMFWQAGSVNYLYSTSWILVFMYAFLRETAKAETKKLKGIDIWMVPLALITGWSNENMGPASFCLAIMVVLYIKYKKKKKIAFWMWEGLFFSLLGSVICILAPGNFVRSEFSEGLSASEVIRERFLSMLTAGCSFLLPSVLVLIFVAVTAYKYCLVVPEAMEIILLITGGLAYMAMILSPHFPDRAAFGIMMVNIAVIMRLMSRISENTEGIKKYFDLFIYTDAIYAAALLISRI